MERMGPGEVRQRRSDVNDFQNASLTSVVVVVLLAFTLALPTTSRLLVTPVALHGFAPVVMIVDMMQEYWYGAAAKGNTTLLCDRMNTANLGWLYLCLCVVATCVLDILIAALCDRDSCCQMCTGLCLRLPLAGAGVFCLAVTVFFALGVVEGFNESFVSGEACYGPMCHFISLFAHSQANILRLFRITNVCT